MKKYIFLITILSLTFYCQAQTFEKNIRTEHDEIVLNAIEINDNEVIFAYNYGEFNINYQTKLFKLDSYSGAVLDSTDIPLDLEENYRFLGIKQFLNYNDTMLIGLGLAKHTNSGNHKLYILHFDSELQISFDTLTGYADQYEKYWGYLLNSDGNIISVGENHNNGKDDIQISTNINSQNAPITINYNEADRFGSILLSVSDIYGNQFERAIYSHQASFASSIIEIPIGDKYHLLRFFDNDHSIDIIDKETLEIDLEIEYPLGFLPLHAVNSNIDSIYYIAGRQTLLDNTDLKYLSYLEVNKNGAIIEQHIYDSDSIIYYPYRTFDVSENNIYFGAVIPFTYAPPILFPERRWILEYKLELNGDVVWQKFYKGEVNYTPYFHMLTSDGGLLIFSARYDWNDPYPNQRDVHILKIDSDGNYIPVGMEKPMSNQKQILAWPNPAKNHVNFTFGLMKDLQIDIYNVHGKLVFSDFYHQSPIIDLSGFNSGLYVYSISDKDGFLERGKLVVE